MDKHQDDSKINLEYDIIRNDFKRAGEASSDIKSILKKIGIDSKVVRKVAIVTYEAEMNIVIHSYGGNIKVTIKSNNIIIEAYDRGPGIENIPLAMKEGYSTATNEVRELGFGAGMGLPNINKCADDFKIKSTPEGTRLLITINF
ncbi:ATP-binding protein [Clostridium sp. D2Q-11]|uniref:ATP-binding protein n=1 Tax=Anaeromonas frigoriresistens TaxID=2683708 RepID=A0A942UX24_9FIRM|nr:ATP-binding protein [Anaeromonas frigoriresistens]MBS4537192.1 ATP-binding protein [Anaeromonas frigoriresistens]